VGDLHTCGRRGYQRVGEDMVSTCTDALYITYIISILGFIVMSQLKNIILLVITRKNLEFMMIQLHPLLGKTYRRSAIMKCHQKKYGTPITPIVGETMVSSQPSKLGTDYNSILQVGIFF